MKRLVTVLVTVLTLFAFCAGCRAEHMWSEWDASPAERLGSERARGVFVYLQGTGGARPMSLPLREIARSAMLDVLRLSWSDEIDGANQEAELLRFVAAEIGRARQQGYSRVTVAGVGVLGRLAIAAAARSDVDVLIALGPIGRPGEDLPGMLSRSRASQVAIVLFSGDDPHDDVHRGRATAFRAALSQSSARFLMIDRPDEAAAGPHGELGRFTRRYRDCLVELIVMPSLQAGERRCDFFKGYAVGSDIWYSFSPWVTRLPLDADPALATFLGRWQGDEEQGAYVILSPVRVGQDTIDFRHGYSPRPEQSAFRPSYAEIRFQLEQGGSTMTCAFENAKGSLKLQAPNELEYLLTYETNQRQERFRLKRQADQP